jgi:hypothetical protein|tara:strand:+ start:174 stop:446 length:273 start_codon:yes stop_codon:yes gene_type:complete
MQPMTQPNQQVQYVMVQQQKPPSDALITAVYILSVCALLLSPLFCGLPGIICALVSANQGHKKANTALVVCIVCSVVGWIFGMMVYEASF